VETAQETSWQNVKTPKNLDSPGRILGDILAPDSVFLCPGHLRSSRGPQMCSLNPWDHVEVLVEPDPGTAENAKNQNVGKASFAELCRRPPAVSIPWSETGDAGNAFPTLFPKRRLRVSGNLDKKWCSYSFYWFRNCFDRVLTGFRFWHDLGRFRLWLQMQEGLQCNAKSKCTLL
jgi:hypothetical protein